jgi:hypothetical protein
VKSSSRPASATSLPRAPRDDAGARSRRYLITMGIRILCFILMVVVTPYGWYTWVFGIGAVFLPYIAVVTANVSQNVRPTPVNPELALPATAHDQAPVDPVVVRIQETHVVEPGDEPDERA